MKREVVARLKSDLEELSRNLWWSWNQDAVALWRQAACRLPPTRRQTLLRNPVLLVRALGVRGLEALASDPEYLRRHRQVFRHFREHLRAGDAPPGFAPRAPIAYFSMEFGLHESLPIYAGGLGILAGDHLKSSSDERLPLVGVGLFYHRGYFQQRLGGRGRHEVLYPRAGAGDLPMEPARGRDGRELRIQVELPERTVRLRVWRIRVGRVPLFLLDADVPENAPADRGITHRLYGGNREDRIRQEIVAGIGGVRLLRAMGIDPGVWHLNEGHVAFLTLERIRELRSEQGLSFAAAKEAVASNTVFTTHTPVPEGNEEFDLALAARYLEPHLTAAGLGPEEYLSLGLQRSAKGKTVLSMTVLALRLSRFRNGVSRLHGEVSRRMWAHLWPDLTAEEVPIFSVTNGVHTPSWVAPAFDAVISAHAGPQWRRRLDDSAFWKRMLSAPADAIWRAKRDCKLEMIRHVREREAARLERLGVPERERRRRADRLLDPEALTIGFARRFALYKRAALLFRDRKRARRIFSNRSRPVQIIFAGKPHPEDVAGRRLFEEVAAISRLPEFRGKVVVLENYDIELCRHLVAGVDVWLNNPRRPQEASGTSGQKVPVNGGLNLSILDGWWCEGYAPETGWAFGKPAEYADPDAQDEDDSADLYRVLEREVVPLYYRRDRRGMPGGWIRMVKASMASLVPRFSTSHMVLEYARRFYRPALENGRDLLARRAAGAKALARWKEAISRSWPLAQVRSVEVAGKDRVRVEVFLPGIWPEGLRVRASDGVYRKVRVLDTLGPGLHVLEIRGVRQADLHRGDLGLVPTHPDLPYPLELGILLAANA